MSGWELGLQILLGQAFLAFSSPLLKIRWPALGKVRPRDSLRLAQTTIVLALVLPLGAMLVSRPDFSGSTAQIWSAPSMKAAVHSQPRSNLPRPLPELSAGGVRVSPFWFWGLFIASLGVGTWNAFRMRSQWNRLRELVRGSHRVRRIGGVEIRIHDGISTPFAFWRPGKAYVLLPTALLAGECATDWRIAVRHELQHHRQWDTQWVHLETVLRAAFGWNPGLRAWLGRVTELQEFACDEALLVSRRVSPRAYARCLIEVAQLGLSSRATLVGTTGMASGISGPLLRRRVDSMFKIRESRQSRLLVGFLGTLMALLIGSAAYAGRSVVRDRRVTLQEAQRMSQNASSAAVRSKFPIVVNEAVLRQLNLFVGTPDGRAYMRDALARMKDYQASILAKINEYGLPEELLAVPIVESGYRNFKASRAAGLWMFIAQTARNYNLRVDDLHDDRLVADMETDAAMRYLGSNYHRFQDWGLAILAYNSGESRVQEGIEATGSRDVWQLIEAGYQGDSEYVAKVIASVLILRNPSYLD